MLRIWTVLGLVLALSAGLAPPLAAAQEAGNSGPDASRTATITSAAVISPGATQPGMLRILATVSPLGHDDAAPTGTLTFTGGNGASLEADISRTSPNSVSAQAAIAWPATADIITITYAGDATHAPSSTTVHTEPSWLPPLWFAGATAAILAQMQGGNAQPTPVIEVRPRIFAISENEGSINGGLTLIIRGEDLVGVTSVTFGGVAARTYSVVDSRTIRVVTPPHALGAVDVRIETSAGSATAPTLFSYIGPRAGPVPIVSSVSPNSGPTSGGTNVTIRGQNFTGANRVTFGGGTATNVVVINDTTITATTPPFGGPNTVDVSVSLAGGETGTGQQFFTYLGPPNVNGVSPNSGPTAGGTPITIFGQNLTGATQVVFGGIPLSFTVVNSNTITAVTPAHAAGSVDVRVTTPVGNSTATNVFTYVAPLPVVTLVTPNAGPTSGGTAVTITGQFFTGATSVTFGGGVATNITVVNDTTIIATTPAFGGANTVDVSVTTPSGTGTGSQLFKYVSGPSVTLVSPNTGPTTGGTAVTITGFNFTGATSVTFGGTTVASFTVTSSTSITTVTPPRIAGTVDVTVTTPNGTATGVALFTYTVAAPTVTAVSPTSGPTSGGTTVTITGTNFIGVTALTFGGTALTGFTVNSATTITAVTPPHAAGAVDIQVTTGGGTATGASLFTYVVPAPTVTAVAPTSGSTSGGTAVTITGTNFTGATSVTFGGTAVTSFTVDSATSITAVTPVHAAGVVDIGVTTAGGTGTGTSLFTYVVPTPTVTSVAPISGPTSGGTTVTITGTNFTGASVVTFGGTVATSFTVDSATSITAVTPANSAGTVDVAVTTPGGTGTGASLFTYVVPAPTVTAVSPADGPTTGGTTVTITGTNLNAATSVTFGGTPAASFTVNSDTSVTAVTPAHAAGTVDIAVTTPGGTGTGASLFTFVVAEPAVTSVSPDNGPTTGGTTVTITGNNFTGATAVTFGGTPVTSFTVNSDTSITATTPAQAAGSVDVAVTTPAGAGTGSLLFTYVAGAPTVTAVSPDNGPIVGGTAVTIIGTNFTGASAVTFGGTAVTSFTVDSDTSITAITPAHLAGAVDVVVTAPGGTGTGVALFSYLVPAPTVISVSPSSGPTIGGTTVTITGNNFTGATSVTFGGIEAASFSVNSPTSITAVTPAHAAGTVDVEVTTPGGTGTGVSLFTYTTAAPTVTAVSPSSGPTAGDTTVAITGTNFTGATAVVFGGATVASFTVNGPTSITAVTPPHAAGSVDVEVTTPTGTATGVALYTFVATPPTVRAVRPGGGPVAGGTTVTILGTDFTSATAVLFGGVAVTSFTVNSPLSITAVTPAHAAGNVDVQVTNPAGTGTGTGLYTYAIAAPTVTAVTPNGGSILGGTTVTITGTRFTGATAVTFGGVAVRRFTVNSPTSITAVTAAHAAGTVDVSVTTPVGTGTGASLYTYRVGVPTVTAVAPSSGPISGGTTATVTGTNFTGATAVAFGGVAATSFTVNGPTSLTAVTPARIAGIVDVTVTSPAGTGTGAALFTFTVAAPTVTAVAPTSGPTAGGATVTITGTSFTGATAVTFGGMTVTNFTVTSATSITAITPAHPGGTVDVQVTTSAGIGTGRSLYSFVIPAPTVTAVRPANGPATGGTLVTITGTNLLGTTGVRFGGAAVTHFIVESATAITVLTPRHAAGVVDVEVTTPGGIASLARAFTFDVPEDSARLRRTQILLTRMVANASGAAISSGVNRAIADGFVDVCDPIAVSGDTVRINFVAPCGPDGTGPQGSWRFWAETTGTGWSSTPPAGDITGDQINALVGATHRLLDNLLVGALVGYETFDYQTATEHGQLQGNGWTIGGYFGWRPLPGILVDGSLSRSEIGYDANAGLASGAFDGHRWLGTFDISGAMEAGAWLLEPSASAYAIWESEDGYTDTLGTRQAPRDFSTGRVSLGFNGTYRFWWNDTIALAPHLGLYGDYYFADDDAELADVDSNLSGWSARLNAGVSAQLDQQSVTLDMEYGGLGSEYSDWAVRAHYSVQF